MEEILNVSHEILVQNLDKMFKVFGSLFILICLSFPWVWAIRRNWDFIRNALAGVDGITDIHELRIGLGYLVLVCFIILFFYMVITAGCFGFHYSMYIYTFVFSAAVGAEAGIITSIISIRKSN